MVKPILLLTFDQGMEPDEVARIIKHICDAADGYLVLAVPGNRPSARILSHKKMRRADYRECANAAKAILEKQK